MSAVMPDFRRVEAAAAKIDAARAVRPADGVVIANGAEMKMQPIRWLWPGWLALGKLHILAGAPGVGKTTLALALAATVTIGGRFPDGTRCEPGNVLIWSGEDDPEDTLLPRLLAAGADPSRVHFVRGTRIAGTIEPFDPARDLVQIAQAAQRIGGVRLVLLDPVVSAVTGDSHKNTEVRRGLQPVVDLAAALNAAAVGITHFSKGTGGRDPTERVVGSVAFGAVARVVLVAAKVKDDDGERRVIARSKSNIAPDDGAFAYSLEQVAVADGITASRVMWGEAVAGTARELLAEQEPEDERKDAAAFLRELLAQGPMDARTVRRHADEAGHAWRTVQRARKAAGAEAHRVGFGKGAEWFLKPAGTAFAPLAPACERGANGASGDEAETFT